MKLAEFVEEALSEILAGIKAAQEKEGGDAVGAEMRPGTDKGWLVNGGTSGFFTVVDFDVSVVAENKVGGKAGLSVWGAGIEGGTAHSSQNTSRVRFSVQLRIPDGAKAPRSAIDRPLNYPPQAY